MSHLSHSRAEHSKNTASTARKMALQYGLNGDRAYFAGLSHDIAKEKEDNEILEWALRYRQEDILPFERELPLLLHGRAAAGLLKDRLSIVDRDILESVTWHVSGHKDMGEMEKVIYCADLLEPGRTFVPDDFRENALRGSLDRCVYLVLSFLLDYRYKKKGTGPSPREEELLDALSPERIYGHG